MNNQAHPSEPPVLVIDLEATCCDKGSIPVDEMEIIEIGACWASVDGCAIDCFQCYVRPTLHPELTPFCQNLLGISQDRLATEDTIASALERLREFTRRHCTNANLWGSWGAFDRNQIQRECVRIGALPPIELTHENLKRSFAKAQRIGKEVGMRKALELAGLEHTGVHHRALDDALNVARLLPWTVGKLSLANRQSS